MSKIKNFFWAALLLASLLGNVAYAGTLSCIVASRGLCALIGVPIYGVSGSSNAHGELASQSSYSSVVCCSGVEGLSSTCSGTHAVAIRLSSETNAHAELNTQSNYEYPACIQVAAGGSVTVGYQETNCDGYDTTLTTISSTTNAHLSNTAYSTQICATASSPEGGSLSVDIVDADGDTVASPSIGFSSKTVLFSHQTSDGTFGTSDQKIRLTNTTLDAPWSMTIAPTSGATGFWSTGEAVKYDFNDPTANAGDGADDDAYGGQMSFDPSGATVTPQDGCTTTGVSLGSSGAFSEGEDDSLTLATANGTAGTDCYWDITDIDVSQSIPAQQAAGSYSLDMMLTVTAI